MKISIEKNKDYVKLQFDRDNKINRPSMHIWLKYRGEINSLESVGTNKNWTENWTLLDGGMTMRRFYNHLYFYNETFPPILLHIDVNRFINFLRLMPMTEDCVEQFPLSGKVVCHKGIGTLVVETDKFRIKPQDLPNHSWVKIGKWCTKGCITNIINAHKIGLSAELKPILSRMVGRAEVYPDCGSKYSFTFDGRRLGLGYNGGIICHGVDEATFSVELNSSNKPHYSVHT